MIEIEGLKKAFNGKSALKGFNLNVEEGECCGLMGPNGAGKSTLIKILATLLPSDEGNVRMGGHDVSCKPHEVRKLVGYLPDVPGLYQDMSVGELLDFYSEAFRLKGEERRKAISRALEESGLAERRDTFVEQLSLGMKQRLVMAKTLLHGPKMLLLDEPATGLDPLARAALREQLHDLRREGVTILISSHILSDLEEVCTRVALIAAGENATDSEGRTVIPVASSSPAELVCEIELGEPAEAAVRMLNSQAGVRVLAAAGPRLSVAVTGGVREASAMLGRLAASGTAILRFDSRGPSLEDRYRKIFKRKEE